VGGVSTAARAALVVGVDRAAEEVVGRTRSYRARLEDLARAGIRRQAEAAGRGIARLGRRVVRLTGTGAGPARHPAPRQVATSAWEDYCRAIRRYVPAEYEGAVTLFRARELPAARPDLGWAPLLPGLEIEVVPGDHHSCVTRHVAAFASRLEARLQRAE